MRPTEIKIVAYGDAICDWRATILAHYPNVQVAVYKDNKKVPDDLTEAEVLIGWQFPPDLLKRLPKLHWIQLTCVGANEILQSPWINSGVVITNTRAIYADS